MRSGKGNWSVYIPIAVQFRANLGEKLGMGPVLHSAKNTGCMRLTSH